MPPAPTYITALLPLATALAIAGCAGPAEPVVADREPPPRARKATNVRQVPVPYGTRLPCETLLSAGAVGEHLGSDVAIEASDVLDRDATSKCWITAEQGRTANRKRRRTHASTRNARRGLQTARVCHVTVYCSFIYDEQTERNKCSAAADTTSLAIGATACRYESPPRVDLLDADSQCRVVVHPASGDIDPATLTSCALAVATELSPARLNRDDSAIAQAAP